jgi:acetyl esterase/lipase
MLNRRGALTVFITGVLGSLAARKAEAAVDETAPKKLPSFSGSDRGRSSSGPNGAPGGESVTAVEAGDRRAHRWPRRARATAPMVHTRKPTLVVFRPKNPNGAAVMLIPGGGYERAVLDKEGYELGRWLNQHRGYTCFVLFYRMPGDGWTAGG